MLSAGLEPINSKVLQCFLLYILQWYVVILKHLRSYLDLRWADNLGHYLTSHKVFNISVPRKKCSSSNQPCGKMRADSATTRGKNNATSKNWTIDRSRKRTSKLHSSVDFSYSFSTVHQVCNTASFSLAPSRSLISALLLPVCTVYISFDQCIRRISMYLNVPLRSRLKPPVCQRPPFVQKPHPGTAEGALGSYESSSLMSTSWPCQRWEDGQKALPCMSYLGPWCWTQQHALWRMNEVVDSVPRLPCLCGTLCHKGSLNTPSLTSCFRKQTNTYKSKILSFFLTHTKEGCFNLNVLSHKKEVFFLVKAKQRGYSAWYDFKAYYRRPEEFSLSFFNCFMRGCLAQDWVHSRVPSHFCAS